MTFTPEQIQAAYYERTAIAYDDMHGAVDSDHYAALEFIDAISNAFGLNTFLDVGAGTGRGVRFLLSRGRDVRGVEPVGALIEEGERNGLPKALIALGDGKELPYEDSSIDAVFECGVLHHVARPERVVGEMMRVARKAVFLSDANRFGQGRLRLLKLALYKLNLWNAARFVQTKGKMYSISEGDGLYYSYSIFDSYAQLASWADKIWMVPTGENGSKSWLNPLITSPQALVCAFKSDPLADTQRTRA